VLGVGTLKGEVSDLKMLVERSGFVKERFAKKPERELALTNLRFVSQSAFMGFEINYFLFNFTKGL